MAMGFVFAASVHSARMSSEPPWQARLATPGLSVRLLEGQ